MSHRVYVASPLALFQEAQRFATTCTKAGLEVASSWHTIVGDGAKDPLTRSARKAILDRELSEVESADALVAYVPALSKPRMTLGEVTWALAFGLDVLWVGSPAEQHLGLFTEAEKFQELPTLETALRRLLELAAKEAA